ncbi:CLUMA_CG013943, isoform A [Clunio marinus]|uniref:CLUMA_CG013943, isoform A n=1 Tax=Clunio marinus TaxID=568069 RepID=A0A1J1ILQ2_9DIPT|nr:CLUMA_CG013943, isoform A [Clunio marinus]
MFIEIYESTGKVGKLMKIIIQKKRRRIYNSRKKTLTSNSEQNKNFFSLRINFYMKDENLEKE